MNAAPKLEVRYDRIRRRLCWGQRGLLSNARAFLTMEEAEQWLDQPDERAA